MKKFGQIIGLWGAMSFVLLMGCVDKFEADVSELPTEGLVIEGNIISDSTVVFHLNKKLPLTYSKENEDLYDTYLDVDAELYVHGSDGTSWVGHGLGEGQYQVRIGTLKPDVEYHLEVKHEGDVYLSEPQRPVETIEIENLTFSQPDLKGPVNIYLDSQEGSADGSRYYLWYFEEDWEVRAEYVSAVLYNYEQDKVIRYDYPPVAQGWCYYGTDQIVLGSTESNVMNKIVGKSIHSIKNTDRRLSVLYSIRVYQRTLTRQEYEYYQERVKLNKEMGGLFTPLPSEFPTNITCSNSSRKVIGYVGCNMGVTQRQLYISTDEVAYVNKYDCKFGEAPEGTYREKYAAGFQICDDSFIWAKGECVDVTWLNADPLGRPDWWPNPYLYYPQVEADTH